MPTILFQVGPIPGARGLQVYLDALVAINRYQIRRYKLPALYRIPGIRYEREPPGRELWVTAYSMAKAPRGARGFDCEDLASYLAAYLQTRGKRARAVPRRTRAGWHIVVEVTLASGRKVTLDPSRKLGM